MGDRYVGESLSTSDLPSGAATDAEVAAGYEPLDSDLTAIAALATTAAGRSLLDDASVAAIMTTLHPRTAISNIATAVAATDVYLSISATGTFALPAATNGRILEIKATHASGCTLDADASETIDGAATVALVQYQAVRLYGVAGTGWEIMP